MTTSSLLINAFKLAEASLADNLEKINQINVFPVADNDTGSNLFRTVKGVADTIDNLKSNTQQLEAFTDGVFLKASGNSGMMFSMFLSHFTECFVCDETIEILVFSKALLTASQQSKNQIDNFVNGTLISYLESVALGMMALPIMSLSESNFTQLLTLLTQKLNETAKENPYLNKKNIVDAGAMGMHCWLKGFIAGLCQVDTNHWISNYSEQASVKSQCHSIHWETKPNFSYCVQTTLTISQQMQPQLSNDLSVFGDCNLNLYRNGKSRIHIHTNDTKALFKKMMSYAEVIEVKIDNMMMQYQANQSKGGIAIVTDSSADIPQAILDRHHIHCIPLIITQGEQVMLDGLTIDSVDLPARIKSHSDYPKTASPSLGMIQDTFSWLSKTHEHVIAISLSAKMSATHQAFKTSAKKFNNVSIIDSRKNSGAHGWLVVSVAELVEKGLCFNVVLEKTKSVIDNIDIFVLVNNFEAMIKSGRVSRSKAWVAKAINLKPIVGINQKGDGFVIAKTMSLSKQMEKIFTILQEKNRQNPIKRFSILHANHYDKAKKLEAELEKKLGLKSSGIMPVSSVIHLHAGQGAIAVAIEQGRE